MGSLLCVGLYVSEPEFSDARLRELYRHGWEVPSAASVDVADLTAPPEVIQITIQGRISGSACHALRSAVNVSGSR
jgi:hypothetical protein